MRQPFFSIAAAVLFCLLGFLFGTVLVPEQQSLITVFLTDPRFGIALSGIMFIMAYFSIVHMKHD